MAELMSKFAEMAYSLFKGINAIFLISYVLCRGGESGIILLNSMAFGALKRCERYHPHRTMMVSVS